jgi:hypothetical protein
VKRSPPVCPRTTCTTCTTSTTCLILSSSVVLRCFCALPNRFSVLPGLPDLLPFTKPVELKPARCFQEASWVKVEWNLLSILEIIGTYIASLCLVDLTTEQTKRSSGSLIPGQDLHSVESVRATKWKLKEKPGNHSAFHLPLTYCRCAMNSSQSTCYFFPVWTTRHSKVSPIRLQVMGASCDLLILKSRTCWIMYSLASQQFLTILQPNQAHDPICTYIYKNWETSNFAKTYKQLCDIVSFVLARANVQTFT